MQPAGQRAAAASPDWPREPPLAYNGLAIDRASGRRGDEAWLRGIARHPGSRLLALWRDRCLVDASGQEPVAISMSDAGALSGTLLAAEALDGAGDSRQPVFLGLDGAAGVFAVDLSDLDEAAAARLAGASAAVDTRQLFAVLDAQRGADGRLPRPRDQRRDPRRRA